MRGREDGVMMLAGSGRTVAGVILAGAANDGELAGCSDEPYEALVRLAGKPMVQYVVDAVRESCRVDSALVVGFPEFRDHLSLDGVDLAPAGQSFIDSITVGLEMNSEADYLLFVTSDVPLISAHVIDEFIDMCLQVDGEFFVPIVQRETSEAQFPGIERTYARLRDGSFTLGNCFFGSRPAIERTLPRLRVLYEARKNPVRIAASVGIGFLIRLVTGTCTVEYAERVLRRITGTTGRAVICSQAEIALDVDDAEQLRGVEDLVLRETME